MKFILFILLLTSVCYTRAQEQFFTRQGYVSFYSHTPVEDIKADNNQVLCILDMDVGEIAVTMLMKSFTFEKALMQQHFNENYVESDKYPKAFFSGNITNLDAIKKGDVTVAQIYGNLTIKDATHPLMIECRISVEPESIVLQGKFMVTVANYNIKIPAIVRRNIAREVEVSFHFILEPYQ